jgi:RNA ligase (TIGR02306 family)
MSTFEVAVVRLDGVAVHPNADALELAQIGGYNAVVQKDIHKAGNLVVYVPEDSILPASALEAFGFTGKLAGSQKNRVKAVRLRGEISQGLVLPLRDVLVYLQQKSSSLDLYRTVESEDEISEIHIDWTDLFVLDISDEQLEVFLGFDLAEALGITKYEEAIPVEMAGRIERRPSWFPKYTDIENIKKFNRTFVPGETVIVTEKLHGTNFGAGMAREEFNILGTDSLKVSSRNNLLLRDDNNLYWRAAIQSGLDKALTSIMDRYQWIDSIVIYGEVIGHKVQDLGYGYLPGTIGFRWFDVLVNGVFLNEDDAMDLMQEVGMGGLRVPVLYRGPFSEDVINELTEGKDFSNTHIREGVVVKPVIERAGGRKLSRVILKSIATSYLLRKGGTERH